MVTKLGKFFRKLRIDEGELLYDMAQNLGVSSAFLSKVENGKKKPPQKWEETIISMYELEGEKEKEFRSYFFEALNMDSIDISSYSKSDKDLMLSFARKFDGLDKSAIRKLLDFKEI